MNVASELVERSKSETFSFSELDESAYAKLKADEEDMPGMTTPIDELVAKFQAEGLKVTFGDHPASGNVFILPATATDVEMDSVFPRHLKVTAGMDPALKQLIEMNKALAAAKGKK